MFSGQAIETKGIVAGVQSETIDGRDGGGSGVDSTISGSDIGSMQVYAA